MDTLSIFGLQLVLSLTVVALVANWFVAPWLRQKPAHVALTILLFPHALRHLGRASQLGVQDAAHQRFRRRGRHGEDRRLQAVQERLDVAVDEGSHFTTV